MQERPNRETDRSMRSAIAGVESVDGDDSNSVKKLGIYYGQRLNGFYEDLIVHA